MLEISCHSQKDIDEKPIYIPLYKQKDTANRWSRSDILPPSVFKFNHFKNCIRTAKLMQFQSSESKLVRRQHLFLKFVYVSQ